MRQNFFGSSFSIVCVNLQNKNQLQKKRVSFAKEGLTTMFDRGPYIASLYQSALVQSNQEVSQHFYFQHEISRSTGCRSKFCIRSENSVLHSIPTTVIHANFCWTQYHYCFYFLWQILLFCHIIVRQSLNFLTDKIFCIQSRYAYFRIF